MKVKVLFVCIHNSARSQMAEALLNSLGGRDFQAESAGIEPGVLNPLAVAAMEDAGLDISGKKTQSVFDLFKRGELYHYVVTVCDEASAEKCPVFPGVTKRLHWGFREPSRLEGTFEQKLEGTKRIRDEIKTKVEEFVRETRKAAAGIGR